MADLKFPYARWNGAGDRSAAARHVIYDQPTHYRDRYGCRFTVPANVTQLHFAVPEGRRWIVWHDKVGNRHIRDISLAR